MTHSGFLLRFCLPFSIVAISIYFLASVSFLLHQNLWVDESTQLSGITLSYVDIARWLSGAMAHPFPVPADRMPLLAYYWQKTWSLLLGSDVTIMRLSSLVCVTVALVTMTAYFLQHTKRRYLYAALLFLCLSPNLVVYGVEIRAYALFYLWATIAAVIFLDLVASGSDAKYPGIKLMGLAVTLGLAMNTHFFGVVLTASMGLSYLGIWFVERRVWLSVPAAVGVALIVLVASMAAAPFVLAAMTLSGGGDQASLSATIRSAIQLIYRLIAHQSMAEIVIAPWVAGAAVYMTIAASLIFHPSREKIAFVLVLGIGYMVALLAAFIVGGFNPLAPHYNVWMLPCLAILFTYCVADLPLRLRLVVLLLLVSSTGVGQWHMVTQGDKYAHTRFHEVERRVDEYASDGKVSIVYAQDRGHTWFAGAYRYHVAEDHPSIRQYVKTDHGFEDLLTNDLSTSLQISLGTDTIVVVSGKIINSSTLVTFGNKASNNKLNTGRCACPYTVSLGLCYCFGSALARWHLLSFT
ncbi:MAG: hypothetical protein AAF525_18210 [Pseudomonadota bacterium]